MNRQLHILGLTALLAACGPAEDQTMSRMSVGDESSEGFPCSVGGGGGADGVAAKIVFGGSGDSLAVNFDFAIVGRGIDRSRDQYLPAAFRPGGPGMTGGSIGRWVAGVDTEGALWLHHRAIRNPGGNVFLVEEAEAPDSGMVLVQSLNADLSSPLDGCITGNDIDSLLAVLNRIPEVAEFVGAPLAMR